VVCTDTYACVYLMCPDECVVITLQDGISGRSGMQTRFLSAVAVPLAPNILGGYLGRHESLPLRRSVRDRRPLDSSLLIGDPRRVTEGSWDVLPFPTWPLWTQPVCGWRHRQGGSTHQKVKRLLDFGAVVLVSGSGCVRQPPEPAPVPR